TSTVASIFPYASTTAITSTNASTTNLVISGLNASAGQCLSISATGAVVTQSCSTGNFSYLFGNVNTFGTSTAATTTSILTQGVFFSSSTIAASQFPYASSTAFTAGNLFATNALFTGATTSAFAVNGSSTISGNLNVSGNTFLGGTLSLSGNLSFVNATGTALNLTGPFTVFASSTIGNGTQGGGLTINGGATTTGNLNVLGNTVISGTFAADSGGFNGALSAGSLDLSGDVSFTAGSDRIISLKSG